MVDGPAISVRDLVVERGGRVVLPGLSLDVDPGTVCGLLGPSGGGKSTLLRAIVGTQVLTSGDVKVLGLAAGSAELRHRVGYMTQSGAVYADLSAEDNLRFFASVLGVRHDRVGEVLALVDMADAAGQRVDEMSGGQRARVSLAAALLGGPEVLVLDEPTVGLDPVLRRSLWDTFKRLAGEGVTLLVSSHVMDEARHCDELVLLREGVVLAQGSPEQLFDSTGAADIEAAFLALVDEGAPA
ncbi:MAG: ABC transporter ATP-binding protein [Baekduia sp.]